MTTLRKIVSSDSLFFNKVLLKPNVSNIFVKSITVIDSSGISSPLISYPFILDKDILIDNKNKNSIALEIVIEHPFANDNDSLAKFIDIDINRVRLCRTARIETKPTTILYRDSIHVVPKIENSSTCVIDASIGVRGLSFDDRIILNESVRVGIGKTGELNPRGSVCEYEPLSIYKYKDGLISKDKVLVVDRVIQDFDESCVYVYKPKIESNIRISDDVELTPSGSIVLLNKDIHKVEVTVAADILDIDGSEPIIKYIGVVSK